MAQIDLSAVWNPDPSRRTSGATLRGMARLSYKQLRHRFLESLLILLGIALGVGVLTGMSAFLRFLVALDDQALRFQSELKAVNIRPRAFDTSELWANDAPAAIPLTADLIEPPELTTDDLLAVRQEVSGAAYVVGNDGITIGDPIVAVDGVPLTQEGESRGASLEFTLRLQGSTPDQTAFRGRTLIAGRTFNWDEYAEGRRLVILEEESVEKLFPGLDPAEAVGRILSTRSSSAAQGSGWQIVGVVAQEEQNPFLVLINVPGARNEIMAYAPHTAIESQPAALMQINVTPAEGVTPEQLVNEIEVFFAQRLGPDRVTVTNPAETLRDINRSRRTTVLTLMGLAALALFVAAINILNLFTARVIRRRRLMAMSVALGADRRLLFRLTLTEALLLGIGGGLLGMLPAYGVITILKMLLMGEMQAMSQAFVELISSMGIGWPDALLGLLAGAGVSIAFGLYPAYLGASIDAAQGLRGE